MFTSFLTLVALAAFVVFLVSLATFQVVEIWRHSSLFASIRARVELWSGGLPGFLSALLMCGHCLSIHVAFWLTAWVVTSVYVSPIFQLPVLLPVLALAGSCLANIVHDWRKTLKCPETSEPPKLDAQ